MLPPVHGKGGSPCVGQPPKSRIQRLRAIQSKIKNSLQSPKLDPFITDFPERCTNQIDRVIFTNEGTAKPRQSECGTGILPVVHGRDAHATRGSAGASNELAPLATSEPTGRVHIYATQYFGGIPAEVWSFRVGGYQVCEKWLKDRKGRTLDYVDIQHYQKIIVALHETIRLMVAMDQTIASHGGWPGAFTTPSQAPTAPALMAPIGETFENPPVFAWESERADWYRVYVQRIGSGAVLDQWTADATLTPAAALPAGQYAWWVGAWNRVTGRVVWSERGDFTIQNEGYGPGGI